MVSATDPTFRSALIVMTPAPLTSTFSRLTVLKPVSVNVTVYEPGSNSVSRYCPVLSVTALRDFSISAELAASTVTPGSTAPDESFTTPASVACANAEAGTAASQRKRQTTLFTADIYPPTLHQRQYVCETACSDLRLVERVKRSCEVQKTERSRLRALSTSFSVWRFYR